MVVVELAADLKMVASAVQSLRLKKWTYWLADGLVDDIFTRLVSNNFLHMFLFFIYKHRYKSKEKKGEKGDPKKSSQPFVQDCKACNFIKKRIWHRCFPMNIAKHLFLQNTSGWCFCLSSEALLGCILKHNCSRFP